MVDIIQQLGLWAIILHLRFQQNVSYSEIPYRVRGITAARGITAEEIKRSCQRIRKRAGSDDLDALLDVLKHFPPLPRVGRPGRVETGSQTSIRVREGVRGGLRSQDRKEAGRGPTLTRTDHHQT
jgi:hypothetical protein